MVMLFACKKSDYIDGAEASISIADSVIFDTVFTAQGSATHIFKIFNDNKQKIRINNIQLEGGSSSAYQINVNGEDGIDFNNIDIDAGDSIYCFVRVNIDPTDSSSPFLISDSIGISFNSNIKYVQLQAYGQNAVYLSQDAIAGDTTWTKDLPIVLLKSITIPDGKTLTIEKGSRIYCHANAGLLVEGKLLANGDSAITDRISFTTDRTDYVNSVTNSGGVSYKNLAGAWPGIDFGTNSANNVLSYVTIKNAIYAITDTLNVTVPTSIKLDLQGCIIQNNSGYGVLSRLGNVTIVNSLISNNGSGVGMYNGGQYVLAFNTIVGYSNQYVSHNNPSIYLGGSSTSSFDITMTNCIIWGNNTGLASEIGIGSNFATDNVQVTIDHTLAKYADLPTTITLSNMLQDLDPDFLLIDNDFVNYDFHLSSTSPCVGAGTPISTIGYDLSGNKRNTLNPSMGCYENL